MVEVRFDPKIVDYAALSRIVHGKRDGGWFAVPQGATQCDAAQALYGRDFEDFAGELRADDEPKYYLARTELRHVPMTEAQAVRVNALARAGGYEKFLSPRQLELLARVRAEPQADWPNAIGRPIVAAWRAVEATTHATARDPASTKPEPRRTTRAP